VKTWVYIAAGAALLLVLLSRKSAPANNTTNPNADMGGVNFGALDPSTWG
jgi:hypothetical protein